MLTHQHFKKNKDVYVADDIITLTCNDYENRQLKIPMVIDNHWVPIDDNEFGFCSLCGSIGKYQSLDVSTCDQCLNIIERIVNHAPISYCKIESTYLYIYGTYRNQLVTKFNDQLCIFKININLPVKATQFINAKVSDKYYKRCIGCGDYGTQRCVQYDCSSVASSQYYCKTCVSQHQLWKYNIFKKYKYIEYLMITDVSNIIIIQLLQLYNLNYKQINYLD